MSTFSGLTNALQSLNAQQYALATTGENVDNANTPGYTRKTVNLQSVGNVGGVSRLYATTDGLSGTVDASTATRTNDPLLDARNRVEQGLNSYAQTSQATQAGVETVFNEPSDTGLATSLTNFWASWSSLANEGGTAAQGADATLRGVVLAKASTATGMLNAASSELSNQLTSANLGLTQTVASVNTEASQVAVLNKQIQVGLASGEDVSTLSDQRDALLVKLSTLSGATSTINSDGTATVTLPGTSATPVSLVTGNVASTLATTGSPVTGVTLGGTAVGTAGGTLQGDLDAITTTVPTYQASLDAVAQQLATTVNAGQAAGKDLTGTTGAAFFSAGSAAATTTNVTAANIKVAITDTNTLAASKTATLGNPDTDGSNAASIAALQNSTTGADSLYRKLIGALGSASASATQAATVQQAVTTNVSNLQQSASGVSIDEETTNVLIYQRAYQASSRVLTTIDSMLDTLINHTGTVGL